MEKRNLYVLVVVVVVAVLALAILEMTGRATLGDCNDSDNGIDYKVKGVATYGNRDKVYIDECLSRTTLKEYYCLDKGSWIKSDRYMCQNECVNGACID